MSASAVTSLAVLLEVGALEMRPRPATGSMSVRNESSSTLLDAACADEKDDSKDVASANGDDASIEAASASMLSDMGTALVKLEGAEATACVTLLCLDLWEDGRMSAS